MKTENLVILGLSIWVVYYFFMRNEKPSESSYFRVGSWQRLSSGGDKCCNPPKCYRAGCTGAPCCDKATGESSRYKEIPSPNYNLTDMPLRLAQITFGPESNYSARALSMSPIDIQGKDKKKKKKKKKAKSRPMF